MWVCGCASVHNKAHNQKWHPLERNANKYNETITSNNGICLYCDDLFAFWNSLDCGIGRLGSETDIDRFVVRFEYATRSHRTQWRTMQCNHFAQNMEKYAIVNFASTHSMAFYTWFGRTAIERDGMAWGDVAQMNISLASDAFPMILFLSALSIPRQRITEKKERHRSTIDIWVSLVLLLFVCSIPSARQTHNEKLCRKYVSHFFSLLGSPFPILFGQSYSMNAWFRFDIWCTYGIILFIVWLRGSVSMSGNI